MASRAFVSSLAFACLFALSVAGSPVSAQQVSDKQVEQGIQKLVQKLWASQNPNGDWEPAGSTPDAGKKGHACQYGGETSLVAYSLLASGVSYQDPRMKKALTFLAELKEEDMKGVYSRGMRAHVWSNLPDRFKAELQEDVYWLHAAKDANFKGDNIGWGYDDVRTMVHTSAAQYGCLGLWEGHKRGVTTGSDDWQKVENYYTSSQNDDGGWGYHHGSESRGSMTLAGLTCLYVTQEYVHSDKYKRVGAWRSLDIEKRLAKGLEYMDKQYRPDGGHGGHKMYYLYGVERVGLASGVKYFNGKDWFTSGAKYILDEKYPKNGKHPNVPDAFGLLFLIRGSRPVMVNKLEIAGYDWNNRPRDVAKMTDWVADEMEQDMIWNRVPIKTDPQGWMNAPILYLASHKALTLTAAQKEKIKTYIDLGGLLVTTADNDSYEFTSSVKEMMEQLYSTYRYAKVPEDDELMYAVSKLKGSPRGMESLHNGVRHLAIHFPKDISWDLHSSNHRDPDAWKVFANIVYYATEGTPRKRVKTVVRKKGSAGKTVAVIRGKYDGNWNPEPAAWDVQKDFMSDKVSATVQDADLSSIGDAAAQLVHVVGTAAVDFSGEEQVAIKNFVSKGGVILFEDAGGQGEFSGSALKQLRGMFPDQKFKRVNATSPLVAGDALGGFDASKVGYRKFSILKMGPNPNPNLDVMSVAGKPRVIVSRDDLSSGMLQQPIWAVYGYNQKSAGKLITNISLHAANSGG